MGAGDPPKSFLQSLASKKWIPMKTLSDEEYESMLREKLLRVEAEMAVMDEEIGRLREEERRGSGGGNKPGAPKG